MSKNFRREIWTLETVSMQEPAMAHNMHRVTALSQDLDETELLLLEIQLMLQTSSVRTARLQRLQHRSKPAVVLSHLRSIAKDVSDADCRLQAILEIVAAAQ